MTKQGALTADEVLNKAREDLARAAGDREVEQQLARNRLRDQQYHMREPAETRRPGKSVCGRRELAQRQRESCKGRSPPGDE